MFPPFPCDQTSTGASSGLVGHAPDRADAAAGAYHAWRRTPSSVVIARSWTPGGGSGTAGSGKKMRLSSSMSGGVGAPPRPPPTHRPGVLAIGIAGKEARSASGPAKPNRARSRLVAPAPIRPVPGALGGRSPLAHAEHAEGLRSRSRAARSPPQPVPLPSGPLPSYLLSRISRMAPPTRRHRRLDARTPTDLGQANPMRVAPVTSS